MSNHPEFTSLDDPSKTSLAARITEVYWQRVRETGLGEKQAKAMRNELRSQVAACLNHFQNASPHDVTVLEKKLESYDRLRRVTGISRRLLEEPSRLLPGVLGHVQALAEATLGAIPALFGFVTGVLPYIATKTYVSQTTDPEAKRTRPTNGQILVGMLSFSIVYGGLIGLVASRFSDQATVLMAVLLIMTGPFTLGYVKRMRTIVAHVGDRTASWFKLKAVTRLRQAQSELVGELDILRNRYREEVLGWDPLPASSRKPSIRPAVIRVFVIGLLTASAVLFIRGYMDRPIQGLPLGPSPWQALRTIDPEEAERELLRDAQGVLLAAQQLDRLEEQMADLRADFSRGERDFLTQEDQDEIRGLLLAYLDLRSALLKTVWLYRGENTGAAAGTDDQLETNAFLTAYAASALLVEKAWLIYDTFRDDPVTSQQLDLGDLAWGIPAGTFSNIGASLSNETVMSELQMARRRFDSAEFRVPQDAPWTNLETRAALAHPTLDEVFDGIGRRRLERAFQDLTRQILAPVDQITPATSMAISRFRFKERPPHRGLISPEQLEDIRAQLQPGDILVERRNWYISNSLLPGFWPHTALYLGSYEELRELGITTDPRVAPHMSDFQGQNELGDEFAVIEAIGEGVIFTSFEQSVGEADAIAILRPNLSDADLREALGRALSHRGKEYDFDFDFETTDRLVCTELIFRTYDGILEIPPMRSIMGKPRMAANDYVRMWADGRDSGNPQLELVRFLDFDELNAIAVESDAETLVGTLERSRFTFMN